MKKNIITVGLLIVLVISLGIYVNSRSVDLKVGLITDLSGKNSGLGISARNGLKMAIDELSVDRKYNITLITRDHEGSTNRCLDKTKELVEEGVNVIIAPVVSSMAQSVIDGVADSGILIIGPTISTNSLSGLDDDFLRLATTSSFQGKYIADEIIRNGKRKAVLIIDDKNGAYTFGVQEGLAQVFNQNSKVDFETILYNGNHEYLGIVNKIEDIDPDAIVFIANGLDSGKIAQLYGMNNPMPALYGVSWVKVSDVAKYGGRKVEGMILIDSFIDETMKEGSLEFMELYKSLFNMDGNTVSVYFYEAMMLYYKGLIISGKTDSQSVKEAIVSLESFSGVFESYRLDKFGDVVKKMQLYRIKDGEYEIYR